MPNKDENLQEVLDTVTKLIALEVEKAEAKLRTELCKSQSDESQFVRDELISLREDLCRILRGGVAEPGDLPLHLSNRYRRRTAAETKTP